MKKLLCVLLSTAMLAALCACSPDESDVSSPVSDTSATDSSYTADESSSSDTESTVSEVSEPEGEHNYVMNIDDYVVLENDEGQLYISSYKGEDAYIIVPAEYEGKPITTICDTAFENCSFIKGIRVSEGIVDAGVYFTGDDYNYNGFCGCTTITELTLPSTLKYLGVVMDCTSLKEIVIPAGVTYLQEYHFRGCSSLEKVVLPDDLTTIPSHCFVGCTALKQVNMPSKLEWISKAAFGDTPLREFHLPETIKMVVTGAFAPGSVVYLPESKYNDKDFVEMLNGEIPDLDIRLEPSDK